MLNLSVVACDTISALWSRKGLVLCSALWREPLAGRTAPINMQMDGVHCGYYPRDHQGLGIVPISPPSTPTNDGLTRCTSPEYSSPCEDQFHHRYADTGYHNTHYSSNDVTDPYSPPESPASTPKTSTHSSPMHHHLPTRGGPGQDTDNTYSTKSSSRKSSSGSSKSSSGRARKNSYVYDVRLPDEQFLFLVPDLVS